MADHWVFVDDAVATKHVACIASDVGGMRDVIVHGETGLHVAVGDVGGLRAAIQGVLDEPLRAAALGEAGQRRARVMFDLRSMCERTEAVYLQIVAARAEGQVRGLQKLLEGDADCTKIAQQLLATRHALDSTYVRLNLSVAEQELAQPQGEANSVGEVLDRLQHKLGRSR